MNCPNCDNDLMVRLEPQGAMRFLRFLPMESYYCVKCGKRITRLSGPSSNPALGVALMVLVLAGMALAVWRSSGDREAAKPAAAPAPAAVAEAPAPPAEPRSPVAQAPAPPAPAAQPETPPAAPPAAPAAKPGPASKTVTIPARPAAEAAKPATPPAKVAAEPAKVAAATPEAAPPAKTAAAPAKPAAEAAKPAATGLRTISAVTVSVSGGATHIAVAAGSPIEGFNAFPLAGPARFVLDLPGRFAYRGAATIPASGGAVSGVRVGAYPDKVRLVLDYAKPGPDGRPAKPPTVASTPQGLTITAE